MEKQTAPASRSYPTIASLPIFPRRSRWGRGPPRLRERYHPLFNCSPRFVL